MKNYKITWNNNQGYTTTTYMDAPDIVSAISYCYSSFGLIDIIEAKFDSLVEDDAVCDVAAIAH